MSPWGWKFILETYRGVYVNGWLVILHTMCAHVGVRVCVKKEYVKSSLKRHLNTQFFYFFGKFFILKMIHIPFKISIQCNNKFETVPTTNHNLLGHICYTPCLLNNYVKSAIKRHLNTHFFYFFGKFCILKMIHIPFKFSVQCNNIFEIITTC
jgi:hypothetical protein